MRNLLLSVFLTMPIGVAAEIKSSVGTMSVEQAALE